MKYVVIVEKAGKNYSAYVPDLPGCIATGRTRAEALRRIRVAIRMHIAGMIEDGIPVPKASAVAKTVVAPVRPPSRTRSKAA